MISRDIYLRALLQWRDKDVIKVITGVRRCGEIDAHGAVEARTSFPRRRGRPYRAYQPGASRSRPLLEYHALHEGDSRCVARRRHALHFCLTRCRNVPEFQRAIDSLYIPANIDLYITGSNAYLLSGTLATLLSRALRGNQMLPFSFAEYRTAPQRRRLNGTRCGQSTSTTVRFPRFSKWRETMPCPSTTSTES